MIRRRCNCRTLRRERGGSPPRMAVDAVLVFPDHLASGGEPTDQALRRRTASYPNSIGMLAAILENNPPAQKIHPRGPRGLRQWDQHHPAMYFHSHSGSRRAPTTRWTGAGAPAARSRRATSKATIDPRLWP